MGFINLPATLQNLFASLETRILKLETATRFTAPNVTTDPSLPRKGDIVLNTTSNSLKYVDNTGAFIPLGASTAVSSVTATAPITSSGGLTPNIALTNVGTAGTYTKVTTDASGRVSSGTTLAAADIPNTLNSTTTVNDEFRVKNTGSGAGKIEVGYGATGNQFAYMDLIGDTTYSDYGLRVIRTNGGPNATSGVEHRGTGSLNIAAVDAGSINLSTAGVTRIGVEPSGTANFQGLIVGRGNTGGTVAASNDTGSLSVRSAVGTNAASMSFHRPGIYAINMGLDTDNGFKIGGWSQGGTPYFQMNSSGYMSLPYQVYFYAKGAETNWTSTGGGDAPFNTLVHIRGGVFNTSNYRFTAPIAGVYHITFSFFANGGSATRLAIKYNGASYSNSQNTYATNGFASWSGNMYLNANDYLTVGDWQGYSGATVYMGHSHFSGYLVG